MEQPGLVDLNKALGESARSRCLAAGLYYKGLSNYNRVLGVYYNHNKVEAPILYRVLGLGVLCFRFLGPRDLVVLRGVRYR